MNGYEYSTDPPEIEPQHLASNDAMVFQKHLSTCAPDLSAENPEVSVEVPWRDAVSFEDHNVTRTMRWSELLAADTAGLWKEEAIFDYALVLKAMKASAAAPPRCPPRARSGSQPRPKPRRATLVTEIS